MKLPSLVNGSLIEYKETANIEVAGKRPVRWSVATIVAMDHHKITVAPWGTKGFIDFPRSSVGAWRRKTWPK